MPADAAGALPPQLAAAYTRILEALCAAEELREAAEAVLRETAAAAGCEAAGLRLRDVRGDYPYLAWRGFDAAFVEKERSLCRLTAEGRTAREAGGRPVLECLCGAVIRGRTDPGRPCFTPGGSFWTNSTSGLMASGTVDGSVIRGTCATRGYESVALVPLKSRGEIVGLLQLESARRDRFSPELVRFLETVGEAVGSAVQAAWRRSGTSGPAGPDEARGRRMEDLIAIGEMASVLAHEIKNPLASMMLSATRLRKSVRDDGALLPVAEHLCASINMLNETVSRVTGAVGRPRMEVRELALNGVLEDAVQLIAPRIAAQGVNLDLDLAGALPAVRGDPNFLKRAFLNLMANSLDAMSGGGELLVSTRSAGDGWVEAVIADSGPGVPPEMAGRLFRPFETGRPEGTGLGLTIVRRIVDLHSGSVELRPREPRGTEAAVRLPAAGEGRP
jgi:signal transduction histidine kinase